MSRRTIVLLIAALIAAFTAISVRNHLTQVPPAQEAVQAPAPSTRVLVAKRDMMVGTFVQGVQDLDFAPLPEGVAPKQLTSQEGIVSVDNFLFEGAVKTADFNGAVVRRTLRAGEAVPQSALMKSGEGGFMSAVLEPGMRAVSIAVNATTGNAGFVSPGDRVDLIVTHHVKTSGGGNSGDEVIVSETFTRDVRVVAVDQMLDNPENKAILAKTITVEVSPRQAEQVAVASEMGHISLALRSLTPAAKSADDKDVSEDEKAQADNGQNVKVEPMTKNELAMRELYGDDNSVRLSGHKSQLVPRVTVIRGDKSENVDFYQGKQ